MKPRSEIFAQTYCRISSNLQTMATKGYNPFRDQENIKIPELRRIGLRIQGAAGGAHSRLRNPWRNTEDGAINK